MDYSILRFPEFKTKALTLSYDDGAFEDERLTEIFYKYNIKCTFNLNSGGFNDGWRIPENRLKEIYLDKGFEILVHGAEHLNLLTLNDEEIKNEILTDKNILERISNKKINGLAYAYSGINEHVKEILKQFGFVYGRTNKRTSCFDIPNDFLELNPTCHHNSENLFELLDTFLQDKKDDKPKLFYMYGHSHEFDKDKNWDRIEKFCMLASNHSDVWYENNSEIVNYILAFNCLQMIDNKIINNSDYDLFLEINGKKIVVPKHSTI